MKTTLYLDIDGVLHPDIVYASPDGLELRASGSLFMHAPVLIEVLAYHPEVEIILSSSWVNHLGCEATLAYLPEVLRNRVTGTTWKENNHQVGMYAVNRFSQMTRFEQIWEHVCRNNIAPTSWLVLDDLHSGSEPWVPAYQDHLILCDGKLGLGDPEVQAALNTALLERQYPRRGHSQFSKGAKTSGEE